MTKQERHQRMGCKMAVFNNGPINRVKFKEQVIQKRDPICIELSHFSPFSGHCPKFRYYCAFLWLYLTGLSRRKVSFARCGLVVVVPWSVIDTLEALEGRRE